MNTIVHKLALVVAAAAVVALSSLRPAAAEDRGVYDIYLGALKVGIFAFSGVEHRGRYSTAGQLRSTGIVGALADIRYDANTRGRRQGRRYVPQVYEERANIGSRATNLLITYNNGVPLRAEFDPPRRSGTMVDPTTQGDALDLMSVFYALLRDVPEDDLCRFDNYIFDGVRRTRVTLQSGPRSAGEAICMAEYRRIAGFSPGELRDQPVVPFNLVYRRQSDGAWRADVGVLETVYGTVRFQRRPSS